MTQPPTTDSSPRESTGSTANPQPYQALSSGPLPLPSVQQGHPLSPFVTGQAASGAAQSLLSRFGSWTLVWLERLVLALILLAFLVYKIRYNLKTQSLGIDGGLYFDVAMHVRDGHGLLSDLALFNAGFTDLPHPTVLYPLWPLLLGYLARGLPLWPLSIWLPTVFYFLSLLLLYRMAVQTFPGPLFPETWPVLNAGHGAVLMFGMNEPFFVHTSKPFTEGLAFFILFLAFFRINALFKRVSGYLGFEVGLWLGLMVLARSQLILVWMALGPVLLLRLLSPDRRRWILPCLSLGLGLGLVVGEQLLYFSTFMPDPSFRYLMRFDLFRDPSPLHEVPVMVQTSGLLDWLLDRARGVPVAFGGGRQSYLKSFGPVFTAVPLALPFLLLDLKRGWGTGRLRRLMGWMRAESNAFPLFLALLALGGFGSLHTLHKASFAEWNFGTRHGLTAFFLFYWAVLYLSWRPVLGRVVALVLLVGSSYVNFDHAESRLKQLAKVEVTWSSRENTAIVAYLKQEALRVPGLRVIAPDMRIQRFGAFTNGIGYYWMYHRTTLAELDYLCHELGARLLLLPEDGLPDSGGKFAFLENPDQFLSRFARIRGGVSGLDIYVPREQLGERQELSTAPNLGRRGDKSMERGETDEGH